MAAITEIIAATGNRDKLAELTLIAKDFDIRILDPLIFAAEKKLSSPPVVEEVGLTYRDNALLKAEAFSRWSGYPALGDDSGLEVTALGNRPGVYSARYGGESTGHKDKMKLLLSELAQVQLSNKNADRSARFCCSLALVLPNGQIYFADSVLGGRILEEPQGEKGFGYDPIVYLDEIAGTLAELEFAQTCQVGFRAKAARELFSRIQTGIQAR